MKYKPAYHDTSIYGPLGVPIGPLVDLCWKFDIRCQLFFFVKLLKYVITGLLALQRNVSGE